MALTDSDVARQNRQAHDAEGKRLAGVRYLNLDYQVLGRQNGETGTRFIVDDAEWSGPTWQAVDCDSVDWGIELHLDDMSVLGFSWQQPAPETESLVLFSGEVLSRFSGPTSAAVWEVGSRSRWAGLIGQQIDSVVPRYSAWSPTAAELWLPRVTLQIGEHRVELLLGEGRFDQPGIEPSANNIVVLFDPVDLPDWVRS
jgi:hypothetical protein